MYDKNDDGAFFFLVFLLAACLTAIAYKQPAAEIPHGMPTFESFSVPR